MSHCFSGQFAPNQKTSFAMKKILLAAAAVIFLFTPEARAIDHPSNWSLDLKGGITSGFLTFDSKVTPQAGFQVRYAMNPVISFYGDMSFGQFRSADALDGVNGFSNDYLSVGLGTRANVLRMLTGVNSVTENFGLYAAAGIGLMRGDVSVDDSRFQGYSGRNGSVNAVVYRITTGAAYRVSRRVDIFAQAQFNHSGSDLLDGYERANGGSTGRFSGGDSYLNTSMGVSIKFGRSRSGHADWQRRDHRSDPLAHSLQDDITRLEAELKEMERTNTQLTQRMKSLNQTINEFSYLINTAHKEEFKLYDSQILSLQNRMDLIQSDINDMAENVDTRRETGNEHRFFVVAAVFRNMENAERGLRIVRNEGFDRSVIQQDRRRNYYLVAYSGHATREAALEEMRRIRAEVNPESWVYVQ
jgi:hypothetical protein